MKRGILTVFLSILLTGCAAAGSQTEPPLPPTQFPTAPAIRPTPTHFLQGLLGEDLFSPQNTATPPVLPVTDLLDSTPRPTGDAPGEVPGTQESAPASQPGLPAVCPRPNSSVRLVIPETGSGNAPPLNPILLDFLNQGGTFAVMNNELARAQGRSYNGSYGRYRLAQVDLTGDGVQEWVVVKYGQILVYGCTASGYQVLLEMYGGDSSAPPDPRLLSTGDMNGNGLNELVFATFPCSGDCTNVLIMEWDGSQLANLLQNNFIGMVNTSSLDVREVDGALELVMRGNVPSRLYDFYSRGPFREEIRAYRWDGERFALATLDYATPRYRFEAVQDGDRAYFRGDLDRALVSYRMAIFNQGLDWWSAERRQYNLDRVTYNPQNPNPVLPPADLLERSMLEGYARLRLVMIYELKGWNVEAEAALRTLQNRHPADSPSAVYADLAALFLDQMRSSPDLAQACAALVERVQGREAEVFGYAGDLEGDSARLHGDQSLRYRAADICVVGE